MNEINIKSQCGLSLRDILIWTMKTTIIMILLYVAAVTTKAQTFTDEVKSPVNAEATFKFNYKTDTTSSGPIYFFFEYSSLKNTGFEGQLTHDGVTTTMFHNENVLPFNHYVSGPITVFNGVNTKGLWEFHIHAPEGTSISRWGVFTIPEPSIASLFGLGIFSMFISKSNKGKKV